MTTYFINLSARVRCDHCTERILVDCKQEIDVADDHADEADEIIADAIEAQMESDGWHEGNCPACLHSHGKEIQEQRDADADNGE